MRWRAPRFIIQDNHLYKRSLDNLLLRCLSTEEETQAMAEVHEDVCGTRQGRPKL